MTKQRLLIATALAVLLAAFVFGGERINKSSPPQKSGYSTDLNDLRTKFNADRDGKGELTKSYSRVLKLGEDRPAWDVYFLFDRSAKWKSEPPAPSSWMHQLRGLSAERRLDGDALAAEIRKMLQTTK